MSRALIPSPPQRSSMRDSAKVVLEADPPKWLLAAIKYSGRKKRSSVDIQEDLSTKLSKNQSLWTLCSLLIEKPKKDLGEDSELSPCYQMIHIESFVIYVDMVSAKKEMAFGLTSDTLESLSEIYRTFHLADQTNGTSRESLNEKQLTEMQRCFDESSAEFVFRTNATALEEIEEDCSGMLPPNQSEVAKAAVLALFEKPKALLNNDRAQFIDNFRNWTTCVPSEPFSRLIDGSTASADSALSLDQENYAQLSLIPGCCIERWHQDTETRDETSYRVFSLDHLSFPSAHHNAIPETYSASSWYTNQGNDYNFV